MLEQNLQNICYNKYSGSSQIDLPLIFLKKISIWLDLYI